MKFLFAVTLGVLLGMTVFFIGGTYLFNDFQVPAIYTTIAKFPLLSWPLEQAMNLGKHFQVFILSTLLAISVIAYEKFKRTKQEKVYIPPALHHKVASILDPLSVPPAAASLDYSFKSPGPPSRVKQIAFILPLALLTFFFSATVSSKLLSKEVKPTPQAASAPAKVLALSTNQATPIPIVSKALVISEVYYKPDSAHRINNSTNESEWLEIFNPGTTPISLSGWSIKDNAECDNLSGSPIIPPSGIALISTSTRTSFETKWELDPSVLFISIPGRLGNGLDDEDELSLRSTDCTAPTAQIADRVRWGVNAEFALTQTNPATPGKR